MRPRLAFRQRYGVRPRSRGQCVQASFLVPLPENNAEFARPLVAFFRPPAPIPPHPSPVPILGAAYAPAPPLTPSLTGPNAPAYVGQRQEQIGTQANRHNGRLRIRKPLLYPAELRDHALKLNIFSHFTFGRKRVCYRTPSFLVFESDFRIPPCLVKPRCRVAVHRVVVVVMLACPRRSWAIFG